MLSLQYIPFARDLIYLRWLHFALGGGGWSKNTIIRNFTWSFFSRSILSSGGEIYVWIRPVIFISMFFFFSCEEWTQSRRCRKSIEVSTHRTVVNNSSGKKNVLFLFLLPFFSPSGFMYNNHVAWCSYTTFCNIIIFFPQQNYII